MSLGDNLGGEKSLLFCMWHNMGLIYIPAPLLNIIAIIWELRLLQEENRKTEETECRVFSQNKR